MKKQVMIRAWEIAKKAAKKFGCKVREFFRQALIMAWKEVKEVEGVNVMVELKGTDKQIKWAEDIRKNLLMVIESLKSFQEKAGKKIPEKEIALENKEISILKSIAEETEDARILISLYQGIKKGASKQVILDYVCNGYITTYCNYNYTTLEAPALKRLVNYAFNKGFITA